MTYVTFSLSSLLRRAYHTVSGSFDCKEHDENTDNSS